MTGAVAEAERIVKENPNAIMLQQFKNPANPDVHMRTTAEEIWSDTDGNVDVLVAGVGTGGTITGVSKVLKERRPGFKTIAVEPADSPVLAGGEPGPHKIQGIGAGFIPETLDVSLIDETVVVTNDEAFSMARRLASEEGILAGSSSGTLLAAALRYCREQTEPKRVVAFACDTGNKYLSKLYNDFWMEDQGFITREQYGDLRDLIGRPHGERATITVGPNDVLTTAHNRLRNAGFSQLPVMDEGKLVGVVTEETIIQHVYGHPDLMNAPVADAMQTAFIKLDKSESLNNLVAMLRVTLEGAPGGPGRVVPKGYAR